MCIKMDVLVYSNFEVIEVDNNKNRMNDRPKSNSERRKMEPKNNSDLGIIDGKKLGAPPHKEKDHF